MGGRRILTKTRPVLWVTLHDTRWTIHTCTSLCEIMKHIFWNKKGRAKLLLQSHPPIVQHAFWPIVNVYTSGWMHVCSSVKNACAVSGYEWLSGDWSDSVVSVSVEELTCWVVHDHYPPENTFIDLLSQWLKAPHCTADETRLPLRHSPLHQPQLLPNICRRNVHNYFPCVYISLWKLQCHIIASTATTGYIQHNSKVQHNYIGLIAKPNVSCP